ncbi:MAG TPA: hypothetical protein VII13_20485 [Vicinamibacteria bacterium]|jgi:hypothetical protein
MRVLALVVGLALLGAAGAEASWGDNRKLPKPIDFPVVRPKVQEHHKPGKRRRHPSGPPPLALLAAPSSEPLRA